MDEDTTRPSVRLAVHRAKEALDGPEPATTPEIAFTCAANREHKVAVRLGMPLPRPWLWIQRSEGKDLSVVVCSTACLAAWAKERLELEAQWAKEREAWQA